MEAEYDIKNMCLCCLKNELELLSLYKSNLKTLFTTLTHLEISEDDGYPSNICFRCTMALKICSSFVEQCITSYKTLTERQVKRELDINYVAVYDDILLDNSSDEEYDHLTTFNNGDRTENNSIIKNKNSSCENDGIQFSTQNTTEELYWNQIEELELVEEAKNNAKTLRITLSRMPDVLVDNSSNSDITDWEEHDQDLNNFENTEKVSGLCASSFPSFKSRGLKSLIKIETREYKCTMCGFQDRSKDVWLEHQKSHAPEEGESIRCDIITSRINGKTVHGCSMCAYTKPHLGNVKRHIRRHTGERPFKCDICPYASSAFEHLKRHKMIHTGERPFKCKVCPYASITSEDLRRHKMVHAEELPYKYKVFPYSSITSEDVKRRKLVLKGGRPFKCEMCTKTFKYSLSKYNHMAIHLGEGPFKCGLCPKALHSQRARRYNVKKHLSQEWPH